MYIPVWQTPIARMIHVMSEIIAGYRNQIIPHLHMQAQNKNIFRLLGNTENN